MINDEILKKAVIEAYKIISEKIEDSPSNTEKSKQDKISDNIDDEEVRASSKKNEEVEEEEDSDPSKGLVKKKKDNEEEKFSYDIPEEIPNSIKFKDVLNQLNALRAGASTKDDEVKRGLLKYFENLSNDEKQDFFSMLSGFATIMNKAGGVEDAPVPDHSNKQSGDSGEIKKKPTNKIGNSPIVVGESASVEKEYFLVRENSSDKHRCMGGKMVPFGSNACLFDINKRIEDAKISRDSCATRSESRSSYNGLLKYLRMQLRAAQKINGRKNNL